MSESLIFLSELLICSFLDKKTSDSLRKPMSEFPALKLRKQVLNVNFEWYTLFVYDNDAVNFLAYFLLLQTFGKLLTFVA